MVCRDADGNYIELTEAENADLKTAHRTAEMIYEAKKAEGDYHDSMDSSTYLAWRSFVFPPRCVRSIRANASLPSRMMMMSSGVVLRVSCRCRALPARRSAAAGVLGQ